MSPPTDVVANELAIRLFLYGLAALSFYEALKLERPRSYIGWVACVLFAASATTLTSLSQYWPVGVAALSNLVGNPLTWFVLAMTGYNILRPRWSYPPSDLTNTNLSLRPSEPLPDLSIYQDQMNQLSTRCDSLEKGIDDRRLETEHLEKGPVLTIARKRLQRELLAILSVRVAEVLDRHQRILGSQPSVKDFIGRSLGDLIILLVDKGFSEAEIRQKFDDIEKDVIFEPNYLSCDGDDELYRTYANGRGPTTDRKRSWHTRLQQIEYLKNMVENRRRQLGDHDSDAYEMKVLP